MIEILPGCRPHLVELWDGYDKRLLVLRRRDVPRLALRLLWAWLRGKP